MAAEPFNSLGGYTVGIPQVSVIDSNGNVVTNVLTLTGNVAANVVYASYYKWANGNPFEGTAGGNTTQLQFNNNGSIDGIPNVTWNGSNLVLGSVSNIKITGGALGYYLQTDGTGNLQWSPGSNGGNGNTSPGGSNTYIQYNNAGNFGGLSSFTFNSTSGLVTAPNLTVTGTLTASIPGTNITGQVQYAAIANSVAGANVTGAVAYATIANSVAGANVSGAVNYATIANSVAGANVSGAVQYSTIANSVAGANVSGQVGYAAIANLVAGANVSGAVSYASVANLVAGANVTGQVEFAAIANNVAGGNVTGAVAYATIANNVSGSNVTGPVNQLDALITDVNISGGVDGYVLQTNGAGVLTWTEQTGGGGNGVPGGSNTQLQYNNAGTFGGITDTSYNGVTLTLGEVSNVSIGGGTNGYVLQTDGSGALSWTAQTDGAPGGTNTQVQYNNAGNFGGSTGFTFNSTSNVLTVANLTVTGSSATTGNANVTGNVRTSNLTVTQKTNLGSVGNITITGGTNGQYLSTNGSGVLSWDTISGGNGVPGGTDTQLQFNDAGTFGGIPTVTWNGSTLTLGTVANISIDGGGAGYVLKTDGAGILSWGESNSSVGGANTQIQFNNSGNFSGNTNFTYNRTTGVVNLVGRMVANSLTLGTGLNEFWSANTYAATTTGAGLQQLLALPAANLAALEFTIIATDLVAGNRQITKATAAYYSGNINYNEYSQIYVNGPVADYTIDYSSGNIILSVTPESSNLVTYKMQITQYAA